MWLVIKCTCGQELHGEINSLNELITYTCEKCKEKNFNDGVNSVEDKITEGIIESLGSSIKKIRNKEEIK